MARHLRLAGGYERLLRDGRAMTPALASRFSPGKTATAWAEIVGYPKNSRQSEKSAMTAIIIEPQSYASLSSLPKVDIPDNLNLALAAGRSVVSLLREITALWRGPGRLSPQECFYYRLWDPGIPLAEKRRFVGKKAQNEMHLACNSRYWYGVAADKILFHTIMKGASLPVPDLIAVAAAGRSLPGIPNLVEPS